MRRAWYLGSGTPRLGAVLVAASLLFALAGQGTAGAATQQEPTQAGVAAPDTIDGSWGPCTYDARAPYKSGTSAVAYAYWTCTGIGTASVIVELQQYRGAGFWRLKRSVTYTIGRPFYSRRLTAAWACAAGTGTQTYRTQTWVWLGSGARSPTFTSPNARFTCP
jgi:hypothetical protein